LVPATEDSHLGNASRLEIRLAAFPAVYLEKIYKMTVVKKQILPLKI
jgi:hypothetical protein